MFEPWLRFIHIAASAAWIGGGLMLGVIAVRARRGDDAALTISFGRMLQYAGPRVFIPSMVLLLLAGIGLVLVQAHSLTELWILIALGGFALAFLIGAVFMSRIGIELARVVAVPSPDAVRSAQLVGRWLTGYSVVLAILVIVLWDMVFKPGGM